MMGNGSGTTDPIVCQHVGNEIRNAIGATPGWSGAEFRGRGYSAAALTSPFCLSHSSGVSVLMSN